MTRRPGSGSGPVDDSAARAPAAGRPRVARPDGHGADEVMIGGKSVALDTLRDLFRAMEDDLR